MPSRHSIFKAMHHGASGIVGASVVFKVRLSGEMIKDGTKICARSIEMLEEIPYKSEAGKVLRARIDVLVRRRKARQRRRKARQAAKEKLRAAKYRALWRIRTAKRREKQAKDRFISKALLKLQRKHQQARTALLKKLRSR